MKEEERLKHWMKPLAEADRPEPCRQCKHRHMLRWLMDVPFRTRPCSDFERDYGKQLKLF